MPDVSVPDFVVSGLRGGLGANLVAVVLFGSRARRTAAVDSDWDVVVVAQDLPSRFLQRHIVVKRMLPVEVRGRVAILPYTPEEIVAVSPPPSLFHDIAADGEILYDPTGYARRWLDRIGQHIAERGLRRRTTPYGMVWRHDARVRQAHVET